MEFSLSKSFKILERTPEVLSSLLKGLDNDWTRNNEGDDTWSPYDIIGHLIHGEKTDWSVRINTILNNSENKTFKPYDRFAQFRNDQSVLIEKLLNEFSDLREKNIRQLKSLNINSEDLKKVGIHPGLGPVNLQQLIATWVVHDLGHIAQISRVMAKQFKDEVGPWVQYLKILS